MTLTSVLLCLFLAVAAFIAATLRARFKAQREAEALAAQQEAHFKATWAAHQRQLAADAERERQERYQHLSARFGQPDADRIVRKEIWQGMTEEMLFLVAGRPEAIEERVVQMKTQRVLKYDGIGMDRYMRKFTFENGVLIERDESS